MNWVKFLSSFGSSLSVMNKCAEDFSQACSVDDKMKDSPASNFMLSYYFTWVTFNKSFYLNSHKSKIAFFQPSGVCYREEEYVNSIMLYFFSSACFRRLRPDSGQKRIPKRREIER